MTWSTSINKLSWMGFRDSLKDHALRVGAKVHPKPRDSKGPKDDIRDAREWPFPDGPQVQSPPANSQSCMSSSALSSSFILFLAHCGHAILGTVSQAAPPPNTDDAAAAMDGATPKDIDSTSSAAINGDSRRSRRDNFSDSDWECRSSPSPSPTRPLRFVKEQEPGDGTSPSISAVDLTVKFVGAKGLPRTDATGPGSDPYFKATLDDMIGYTSVSGV